MYAPLMCGDLREDRKILLQTQRRRQSVKHLLLLYYYVSFVPVDPSVTCDSGAYYQRAMRRRSGGFS